MAKLVLASGSPRRQELLQRMGIQDFDVRVPDTEENFPQGLSPREVVCYISREKSDAAAALCTDDEIVITADALSMLTALQGRRHTVCTGVTVRQGSRILTEAESTEVCFRPATEEELRAYIATGEPMDKAGAYGIQCRGALFIAHLDGDYFNVMGLPLCRLGQLLNELGVELL